MTKNINNIIANDVAADVEEELLEISLGDFNALKIQSQRFLKEISKIEESPHRNALQDFIKNISIDNEDGELSNINNNHQLVQDKKAEELLEKEILKYSTIIDQFLGRMILLFHVSYSTSDKKGLLGEFTILTSKEQLANEIFKIQQGKIRKAKQDLSEESQNFSQALTQFLNTRADRGFKDVYTATMRRWETRYKKHTPAIPSYYYVKNERRNTINEFANRGPIAEGYAKAVLQNDPKIAQKKSDANLLKKQYANFEQAVRRLMDVHCNKDSVSGLAQGDINKKIDLNDFFIQYPQYEDYKDLFLHFAVKQKDASTASIEPYIKFAIYISKINQNIWKKDLKTYNKNFTSVVEKKIIKMSIEEELKKEALITCENILKK